MSNEQSDILDIIIQYVEGELPEEEALRIKEKLDKNPEYQRQLAYYHTIRNVIAQNAEQELWNELKKIQKTEIASLESQGLLQETEQKLENRPTLIKKLIPLAIAAILLGVVFVIFILFPKEMPDPIVDDQNKSTEESLLADDGLSSEYKIPIILFQLEGEVLSVENKSLINLNYTPSLNDDFLYQWNGEALRLIISGTITFDPKQIQLVVLSREKNKYYLHWANAWYPLRESTDLQRLEQVADFDLRLDIERKIK